MKYLYLFIQEHMHHPARAQFTFVQEAPVSSSSSDAYNRGFRPIFLKPDSLGSSFSASSYYACPFWEIPALRFLSILWYLLNISAQ